MYGDSYARKATLSTRPLVSSVVCVIINNLMQYIYINQPFTCKGITLMASLLL